MIKKLFLIGVIAITPFILAKESEEEEEQTNKVTIGNFAVPAYNQPTALFSFGQNMIGKGVTQGFILVNSIRRQCNQISNTIAPSLLYGISDTSSILVSVPLAVRKSSNQQSSGFSDLYVQYEHAFFTHDTPTYINFGSFFAGFFAPSAQIMEPTLGLGGPGFLFGSSLVHLAYDWYYFVSPTVLLTSSIDNSQLGNTLFYNGGIGHNIGYKPGFIVFGQVEVNGVWQSQDVFDGVVDPDTGGNVIFLSPELWLATKHMILQIGVALPIYQKLQGSQPAIESQISFAFTWTF